MKFRVITQGLNENDEIFETSNQIAEENEVIGILLSQIKSKELYHSLVLEDAKNYGNAACWCGTKGYSYNVSLVD